MLTRIARISTPCAQASGRSTLPCNPTRARTSLRVLASSMAASPRVTLYTAGTPNGWKPSVTLEELGMPYNVKPIDISKNEQKEEWYTKINPNGRIPALVDHTKGDLAIFESGAIMWYLGETYDTEHKLWPADKEKQAEVMSWLMFQMGGLGPMQGQANHFFRYAPETIEYGIKRYQNETKRLFQVLNDHLKSREWLAAGQYTLADIANFTWVYIHEWSGVPLDDLPYLNAWKERIEARPAVQRGLDIPTPNMIKQLHSDPEKWEEVKAKMYGTDKK